MATLHERAMDFLARKGVTKVNRRNAIHQAADVAEKELIVKKIKEREGKLFKSKHPGECAGWDGASELCACGQFEMYWCPDDNSTFDQPSVSIYFNPK